MKIVILDWRTMTMNNDLSTDEFHKFGEFMILQSLSRLLKGLETQMRYFVTKL